LVYNACRKSDAAGIINHFISPLVSQYGLAPFKIAAAIKQREEEGHQEKRDSPVYRIVAGVGVQGSGAVHFARFGFLWRIARLKPQASTLPGSVDSQDDCRLSFQQASGATRAPRRQL